MTKTENLNIKSYSQHDLDKLLNSQMDISSICYIDNTASKVTLKAIIDAAETITLESGLSFYIIFGATRAIVSTSKHPKIYARREVAKIVGLSKSDIDELREYVNHKESQSDNRTIFEGMVFGEEDKDYIVLNIANNPIENPNIKTTIAKNESLLDAILAEAAPSPSKGNTWHPKSNRLFLKRMANRRRLLNR